MSNDTAFHIVPAELLEELNAKLDSLLERSRARWSDQFDDLGLEPLRAYTAKEVAHILGTDRVQSIYEISENELPRVRRIGSHIGFLGINVMAYMHGLPSVDTEARVEQYRRQLLDAQTNIKPLRSSKDEVKAA